MLVKFQKTRPISEKSRYVLYENNDHMSLFNEAEAESNSKAPEPNSLIMGTYNVDVKEYLL